MAIACIYLQVNQNLLYRDSDWWDVGIGGAGKKQGNKVQYVKVRFGKILQLTVLNLQMKKPIRKCRLGLL